MPHGSSVQEQHLAGLDDDLQRAAPASSLSVNAPLRARTGTLTYDVVTGVTDTGEPINGTHTVNVAANAQEWTTEARYSTRLSQTASVSAVAAWRVHPDHDASAPSQLALGVRYSLAF